MPIPTYLHSRNNIWYFNYRIFTSIRCRYNIEKRFIRKSLHASDIRKAVKFSREYSYLIMTDKKKVTRIEELEATIERHNMMSVGLVILKEYEETQKLGTNYQKTDFCEYATLLMALFKWAKEDRKSRYLKGENVFVELKKTGTVPQSYSPFNAGELKLFFNTEMFVKKIFETKFAWRYWIPRIMLCHGMRVEEVSQLLLKNIEKINGVWCFDIRDELDKSGKVITTTKIQGQNTGQQ